MYSAYVRPPNRCSKTFRARNAILCALVWFIESPPLERVILRVCDEMMILLIEKDAAEGAPLFNVLLLTRAPPTFALLGCTIYFINLCNNRYVHVHTRFSFSLSLSLCRTPMALLYYYFKNFTNFRRI